MNPLMNTSTCQHNKTRKCRFAVSILTMLALLMPIASPVPAWAYRDLSPIRTDDLQLTSDTSSDVFSGLFADLFKSFAHIGTAAPSLASMPDPLASHESLEKRVKHISTQLEQNRGVFAGEIISLAAVPIDRNSTPVHGLAPRWRSSDPETVRVINQSQAMGLKTGHAKLAVSAGTVEHEFELMVTERGSASTLTLPPDEPVMTEQQAVNLTLPENNVGKPPGQYELPALIEAAAARTRERHGSSNYSFDLAAAALPGRGINASVNITYNSRVWNRSVQGGFQSFHFNTDGNWLAPGFSIGFGSVQGYDTLTGFGYLLTEPDGTRTQLIEKQSSGDCAKHESTDGTFVETTTCGGYNSPSILVRYANGARVTYGAIMQDGKRYPVTMQDRNGNYITISYIDGPVGGKISSIRDTLNRYINFHYDNTPAKRLVAITVPGFDNSPVPYQTIRFYYETIALQTAGRFENSAEVVAPASVDVIKYVYFPATQSGFRYDYSPYFGVIHRLSQMRGMQVSTASLSDVGSVTNEGTCAAWTHYNYPSTPIELGPPLSDVPKFTWRKDDWLGRTAEAPLTGYSTIETVTPAGCQTSSGNCMGTRTTTITSPDGTRNVSISLIRPATDWQNGLLVEGMVVSGEGGAERIWSKSKFYWQRGSDNPTGRDDPRLERVEVTNDANQTRATSFGYDGYNNRTVIREHDFAPPGVMGPELRRTEVGYETGDGWINNRLLRLPVQVRSIVGGVEVSKMIYKYDDYSNSPLADTPGVMQHVESYNPHTTGTHPCNCHWECENAIYSTGEHRCSDGNPPILICDSQCSNYDPATAYRGNVTKVIAFPDTSAAEEDERNTVTLFSYDRTGNVREAGASCCRQRSFTYTEATGYAYRTEQSAGELEQLVTKTVYDRNTGLVKATVDENDQTTTFTYDPASLRPRRSDGPNGSWSSVEYNDAVFPYYVKRSHSLDASRSISGWAFTDGRGRTFRSRSQTANGFLSNDVEYDVMDRAFRSFNSYTVASLTQDRPAGIKFTATTQRDALGRPLSITLPDSSTVSATYSGMVYTATDQSGKSRRQITDGLGRIVRVDEPDSSGNLGPVTAPVQPSYYEYDGNNNLTRVIQSDGAITQERRFRYDGLSRLTHERQVESIATLNDNGEKVGTGGLWTGVFRYDKDNDLVEAIDARGVKSHFEYDGLHRVSLIRYTGESGYQTPTVTYTYDEPRNGFFNKGRLTKVQTASDATYGIPETVQSYSYDNVGQIKKHSQSIGNKSYEFEYGYNLGGRLVSQKYPGGRVVTSTVDNFGVTQTTADAQRTYLNAVTINDKGLLSELSLGNGNKETFLQNDRTQVVSQTLMKGAEVLQRYDYSHGAIADLASGTIDPSKNNGQLTKIDSWIGSSKQWSQRFGYDQLGRIKEAREYRQGDNSQLTYKQVFDFDRFGNLYRKAASNPVAGQMNPLPTVWIENADVDRATNRFTSGLTYDERGNVVGDSKFRSVNLSYDANSRIVGATRPNVATARTVYDGTGNRVAEKIDDVWRYMIYDIFGHLIAEYGPLTDERGGVKYVHQDRQGSVRVVTNASGFVVSRTDHQVLGAEIGAGVGLRSTGQGYQAPSGIRLGYGRTENDQATGLNHAWFRKLENQAGRWTSPDPYIGSMSLIDPQSFNRYSYVTNDPLNYVDPSGLYEACVHEAMTKYLGRLANQAPSVTERLAGYAGDEEGGADSPAFSATNPANISKCLLGAGPSVTIHFPSAAQLAANIRNYRRYLDLGLQGYESYYQLAGHMLHSIQDALGAHKGYSNRACKGHARHGSAPDRLIGDDKFIAAANKVLQVMANDPNLTLTRAQIQELINEVVNACKAEGIKLTVAPQPGGGGGGGGVREGGGRIRASQMAWWYDAMWQYLDEIDAIEVGGGTVTVDYCIGSDCP